MKRITIWICATLAILAMATYYQVSLSGDGKGGDDGAHGAEAAAMTVAAACGGEGESGERSEENPSATAEQQDGEASEDEKAADPCAESEHTDRPGEQK